MNRLPDDDLQTFRQLAQTLTRRLQAEPDLRDAIDRDPVAALTAEGLPEHLVPLFLRETDMVGDVLGYMDELIQGCLVTSI